MKKKILGGLLVLAIAAVAAFNVSMNTQENEMSALMLANVEALAQEYGGELPGPSITCGRYDGPCWWPEYYNPWTARFTCYATGNPRDWCGNL